MSLRRHLPASKNLPLLIFTLGILCTTFGIVGMPGQVFAQWATGCGGSAVRDLDCSWSVEPIYLQCAPNEMGYQTTGRTCSAGQSGDSTYFKTLTDGYCVADASCAPAYSEGYYYGQGYYQGYYQSYYQGYYQASYYSQGYYQGYYYGQGYYQGYYYGQGYYQGYYYGQGYYQSTYYAEGYYAPVCSGPTVSITASPSRVRVGNTTQLKITASGITTSCILTGPGVSQTLTPTSCNVGPTTITTPAITKQSTYTVSCDSAAATAKVIVNTIPRFWLF